MMAVSVVTLITLVCSAAEKDTDELSGTWALHLIDANGILTPQEKGQTMAFADGKVHTNGVKGKADFAYRIDSTKEPKELDFIGLVKTKDDAKITTPGVYKIERDQLTICLGFSGILGGADIPGRRPTDFTPGGPIDFKLMFVLHREKKGEPAQDQIDGTREPK